MGDNEMLRVMGVLIHGDAAFCGQAAGVCVCFLEGDFHKKLRTCKLEKDDE